MFSSEIAVQDECLYCYGLEVRHEGELLGLYFSDSLYVCFNVEMVVLAGGAPNCGEVSLWLTGNWILADRLKCVFAGYLNEFPACQ